MSCYQSASAVIHSGTTGYVLVVKVVVFSGFVPPSIEKGHPPFNPENVFPVIVRRSVPESHSKQTLEISHNLTRQDEFDTVEILCGDAKPGTKIPVTKE